MRWMLRMIVLGVALAAGGGCDVDPCPGKLTCKNKVCCPIGYPYQCNGQCFTAASACGEDYVLCKPHSAAADSEWLEELDGGEVGTSSSEWSATSSP